MINLEQEYQATYDAAWDARVKAAFARDAAKVAFDAGTAARNRLKRTYDAAKLTSDAADAVFEAAESALYGPRRTS